MGHNRTLGSPLEQVEMTVSFRTLPNVDQYLVNAPTGSPVVVTLDPAAFDGDRVEIVDYGGNAAAQPIDVDASAGQTIAGFGSSLTLSVDFSGVVLTFNGADHAWVAQVSGSGGGGGNAFVQGGNAFGASAVLGTTDANPLVLATDGTPQFTVGEGATGGQLLAMTVGTAAKPTYTFNAEPNTGLYKLGTGSLGLTVLGTEALSIAQPTVGTTNIDAPGVLEIGALTATSVKVGPAGGIFRIGSNYVEIETTSVPTAPTNAMRLSSQAISGDDVLTVTDSGGNQWLLPAPLALRNSAAILVTLSNSQQYVITNTSANTVPMLAPPAPYDGQTVTFSDNNENWGTHAATFTGNTGQAVQSPINLSYTGAGGTVNLDWSGGSITYRWGATEAKWKIVAQVGTAT